MQGDRENQFSGAQALTASAASTDVVKVGANIGIGEPMCVVITVDVAAKSSDNDETYKAKLQFDDAAAMGSATDIGEEVTITRGAAIGTRKIIPIPPLVNADSYMRVYYTLGGTNPTVSVTARLMPQSAIQNDAVFPAGNTIS
jgi:hypothetical protein